jgi:hypothetical protein
MSVETLRRHWRALLVVAVALFIPIGLVEVLGQQANALEGEETSLGATAVVLALIFVFALTGLFGEVLAAGVIAAAVAADVHGGAPTRLGRLVRTIPYGRLIAIDVIFVLGFAIGILLLVVPGVIFLGLFALAAPLAKIEGLRVRAAFSRSRALARGHLLLVLAILVPLGVVSTLGSELAHSAALEVFGESLWGKWVGASLGEMVTATPWALAAVALVYELKAAERSERDPRDRGVSP